MRCMFVPGLQKGNSMIVPNTNTRNSAKPEKATTRWDQGLPHMTEPGLMMAATSFQVRLSASPIFSCPTIFSWRAPVPLTTTGVKFEEERSRERGGVCPLFCVGHLSNCGLFRLGELKYQCQLSLSKPDIPEATSPPDSHRDHSRRHSSWQYESIHQPGDQKA